MKTQRSIGALAAAVLAAAALGHPVAAHADSGWKKHDRQHPRYEPRHQGQHWGPPAHARHAPRVQHHHHHYYGPPKHAARQGHYYGPPRIVYKPYPVYPPYPVYRYAPRPFYGHGSGLTIVYRGYF